MATLQVFNAFRVDIGGEQITGGSRSAPVELTIDGKSHEWRGAVPATSSRTIWEASNSNYPISDFDYMMVEADQVVILELTCDANNGVGLKTFAIEIPANQPFAMTSDTAIANFTTDVATGTADVIDKIRLRNSVATASATVRVQMFT